MLQCTQHTVVVDRGGDIVGRPFFELPHPLRSIVRSTRAGTPPTIVAAGTSRVTTAPAATMASSPTVTPERIVAFDPTHTFRPSTMGAGRVVLRRSGSIPWSSVAKTTLCPIWQPSPSHTPP